MACATLKRSQDFDLLDSNPNKRRKFSPYGSSYVASDLHNDSPFTPSRPTTQASLRKRIKDEIKRLQRRRLIPRIMGNSNCAIHSPLTEDNAAVASCSGSLRCMALRSPHRESQDLDKVKPPSEYLPSPSVTVAVDKNTSDPISVPLPPMSPSPSSSPIRSTMSPKPADPQPAGKDYQLSSSVTGGSINTCSSSAASPVPSSRPPACRVCISRTLDSVPIFTLPQVTNLCDQLIREREAELRQEYDSILSCKLAEQYEAFLKFSHDQLSSRFHNAPMSYVS